MNISLRPRLRLIQHRSLLFQRITAACCAALVALTAPPLARAANIVYVSDSNDPATGFFPPGSGFTDSGFVILLQNAGHNVIRYNQPNAQATLLTPAEVAALNTNDLVIISRCVNSGAFQVGQVTQWNAQITRPLIDLSAFHARNSRLGWFAGNEGADNTPTALTPMNVSNPVTDYLFGGVVMNGTNTASPYDEAMDRNSTPIPSAPVAGGIVYASGTYAPENGTAVTTANFIVGLPAGTPVRGNVDILGGYRMFFAAGSRESAAAPNAIPFYTARENLSPTGEDIFLRAVTLALNNGVAPATNSGPAGVSSQPANTTVPQGDAASFSVTATGAAPRLLIWQRSDGGGGFTNVPGTECFLTKSALKIPSVTPADNGSQFRAVISNSLDSVTSDVVTLTVSPDVIEPAVVGAASLDGVNIVVCYSEAVQPAIAADAGNYQINGGLGPDISLATMRPDGRSVNLQLAGPMSITAVIDILARSDLNGNFSADPVTITATNYGLTGVDVGALNPVGTNVACDANSFTVTGGGLDIGSTADLLRFVYKNVSGDFEARVLVAGFVGTNDHFETTAKAMLTARETTANNSTAVNLWVTPAAPGDNTIAGSYRGTAGAATNSLGADVARNGTNTWLRMSRVGNTFTTFHSTNGTDWVTFGSATPVFGASMNVGVGVVSHRAGKVVTATFSDFRVSSLALPTLLTNSVAGAGSFSASFQTQTGFNYVVRYKDDLNVLPWSTLTTIPGDGTLKSFTDSGPSSVTGTRVYRVEIQ